MFLLASILSRIFPRKILSDTSHGYMAVYIYLDWNAGGNNSNSSLSGLENDADTGWAHVLLIFSIPCASDFD